MSQQTEKTLACRSTELYDRAEAFCVKHGGKKSHVVMVAVTEYLNRYELTGVTKESRDSTKEGIRRDRIHSMMITGFCASIECGKFEEDGMHLLEQCTRLTNRKMFCIGYIQKFCKHGKGGWVERKIER